MRAVCARFDVEDGCVGHHPSLVGLGTWVISSTRSGTAAPAGAGAVVERHDRVAEAQDVAVPQRARLGDPLPVQVAAVARGVVLERPAVPDPRDVRMAARDLVVPD